ncbi:MAG: glutamine-hydrolyzing carbamoyl-phosphate synthase small subunit [Bdellovibrio sp.]|nr:glutamine-hydrolyzing carbamoyl-phosphate synthase small subunit [Bdellovibrio sp.]
MAASEKGVLILENKNGPEVSFSGFLFGAPISKDLILKKTDSGYGEVVFNTSMCGYQEVLTDPSYYGQLICMTVPHVGNTGVNFEDIESSKIWCAGFIIHENTEVPSSWRSKGTLDGYLRKHEIPALYGVDTRALTRHLRSLGVVRGVILPLNERNMAKKLLDELPPFEGRDLISEVTTRHSYSWAYSCEYSQPIAKSNKNELRVIAIDYGVKWNLLRSLQHLGCSIEVVSAKESAQKILERKPHGVFLSNGPGDPSAAPYAVETVKELLGKIPIFGVCMGHQILALALGGNTYKLKFGHRGGNQPVLSTKKVEISSHNHGYAVDQMSLPKNVRVTHLNLNDKTIEGLSVPELFCFSVQYHPEAAPGPHDSSYLFQEFISLMKKFWSL